MSGLGLGGRFVCGRLSETNAGAPANKLWNFWS